MAAIVRVKRRLDDDPVDAVIVACKKAKKVDDLSVDNTEEVKSILKFAGTVNTQNESVSSYIRTALKRDKTQLRQEYKHHAVDLSYKLRTQYRLKVQENRYKVINSRRAAAIDDLDENGDTANSARRSEDVSERCSEDGEVWTAAEEQESRSSKEIRSLYRLFDVVNEETGETEQKRIKHDDEKSANQICCNSVPMKRECVSIPAGEQFVYDLYYSSIPDFDDALLDNLISIQPYKTELMYEEYRDPGDCVDDDDDSNDESNWRNEYPDSGSDFEREYDFYRDYEDEEDKAMGQQMISFRLSDSDEEDNPFLSPENQKTVHLHGSAYAKYKARMMKEFTEDSEDCEYRDEDSDEASEEQFM